MVFVFVRAGTGFFSMFSLCIVNLDLFLLLSFVGIVIRQQSYGNFPVNQAVFLLYLNVNCAGFYEVNHKRSFEEVHLINRNWNLASYSLFSYFSNEKYNSFHVIFLFEIRHLNCIRRFVFIPAPVLHIDFTKGLLIVLLCRCLMRFPFFGRLWKQIKRWQVM